MQSGTRHLELAIEIDSDPIRGSVSQGQHVAREFRGWIALVAAIEDVRSSSTPVGGSGDRGAERLGSHPGAKVSEL